MKLKTLIIDDEQFALDKLKSYVERIPYLQLVAACSGTTEALTYLSEEKIDVIFTDIEMPDIDGIKFIEALTNRPQIVFITAYRDFALEGFRLSAIDYLLKPYNMEDFQRAANKVLTNYQNSRARDFHKAQNKDSIFIKVETRFERIDMDRILYIKGFGEYLQIFVENKKNPIVTISSFAEIMNGLNDNFLQVHRSYAVNMSKVNKVEKNRVIINSELIFPVSTTYRKGFLDYLHANAIGKVYK